MHSPGRAPFPELKFDTAGNSQISLNVLAAKAGIKEVRVTSHGIDSTGRLRLSIELPGSRTVRPSTVTR